MIAMNTNQNPNALSNLQLNYWLSVFFTWIPALIFFLLNKETQSPREREYNAANLNFSLLRLFVYIALTILTQLPDVLGVIFLFGLSALSIVLFVFHIIAAVKLNDTYQRGEKAPFFFNLSIVK
ncbi:DUF4870 domain-containing protein [Leucobacter sp. OH1287]|nr:DUF4870 domain-containing protein [Leucobacter sp. OH1287]